MGKGVDRSSGLKGGTKKLFTKIIKKDIKPASISISNDRLFIHSQNEAPSRRLGV
jgi:hypothetical protein